MITPGIIPCKMQEFAGETIVNNNEMQWIRRPLLKRLLQRIMKTII